VKCVAYGPTSNKMSDLYSEMRYIEIDALSESTSNRVCDSVERVFYSCKTRTGKILNLCYSPFSGDITYNYGKQGKELSLNDFSLMGETFIFKNKNTSYNVSPDKGVISVIQNGKQLSVISCTDTGLRPVFLYPISCNSGGITTFLGFSLESGSRSRSCRVCRGLTKGGLLEAHTRQKIKKRGYRV